MWTSDNNTQQQSSIIRTEGVTYQLSFICPLSLLALANRRPLLLLALLLGLGHKAAVILAGRLQADGILDFFDVVNNLEWKCEWNKGILEKTPSSHIVNIEKMPSSNIVYIVDVKIENLYLVGLRTARADIMTAWYRSGHLLGNAGSSLELWLVPILGPLHAADAPLQDRHPSYEYSRLHFHKARTSRGTPDPGWCWWPHCRGAGWSPAQHTNIFDSKQISVQSQSWLQLKNLS